MIHVVETLAIATAISLAPTVVVEPTTEYVPIVVEDSVLTSSTEDDIIVVEEENVWNTIYIDNSDEVVVEYDYGAETKQLNYAEDELVALVDDEELVYWIADEYGFSVKSWEWGVVVYDTNGQNPLDYRNYQVPNTNVILDLNYYYGFNPPSVIYPKVPKIPRPVWGD